MEYSTVGQLNITMLDYIHGILNAFDESDPIGGGTKSNSAPDIRFKVDEYCKTINAKQVV